MKKEQIKELCLARRIKWSTHAAKRIQERGIARADILHCLETGEIIEDYPDVIHFNTDLKTRKER